MFSNVICFWENVSLFGNKANFAAYYENNLEQITVASSVNEVSVRQIV